jgi:hypothetical protein
MDATIAIDIHAIKVILLSIELNDTIIVSQKLIPARNNIDVRDIPCSKNESIIILKNEQIAQILQLLKTSVAPDPYHPDLRPV